MGVCEPVIYYYGIYLYDYMVYTLMMSKSFKILQPNVNGGVIEIAISNRFIGCLRLFKTECKNVGRSKIYFHCF